MVLQAPLSCRRTLKLSNSSYQKRNCLLVTMFGTNSVHLGSRITVLPLFPRAQSEMDLVTRTIEICTTISHCRCSTFIFSALAFFAQSILPIHQLRNLYFDLVLLGGNGAVRKPPDYFLPLLVCDKYAGSLIRSAAPLERPQPVPGDLKL